MIQDKIKKGDLLKAQRNMWGSFFDPNYGNVNIEIKKSTMFVAVSDEILNISHGRCEVAGFIDNKIVTIRIKEEKQFRVLK